MRQDDSVIVVLGTGGTIAGVAPSAAQALGYTAAALGIQALIDVLPDGGGARLEAEQVAQVDSKDMSAATWQLLARRLQHHLGRAEVSGVVITHGTDTLEETAWFLQRVVEPQRPVVMVAAMRPATSLQADGPQNLADAITVARSAAAHRRHGVVAVMASRIWAAQGLRKAHTFRLDALRGGDAGAVGSIEAGEVIWWRDTPVVQPLPAALREGVMRAPPAEWPRVAVIASHAGSDGGEVAALVDAGYRGLVVAGTGHATLHHRLRHALDEVLKRSPERGHAPPAVWICTRCPEGELSGLVEGLSQAYASPEVKLSPWQARLELQLRLMG